MKVGELVNILQGMPPDNQVVIHYNGIAKRPYVANGLRTTWLFSHEPTAAEVAFAQSEQSEQRRRANDCEFE